MIEGFYRIAFTGASGSGFGILVFSNGLIVGADAAGAIYNGAYTGNSPDQSIRFTVTMNAPAGVTPVQTGIPLASQLNLPISGALSENDIKSENTILLQTPIGPVNIIFKKLRNFK